MFIRSDTGNAAFTMKGDSRITNNTAPHVGDGGIVDFGADGNDTTGETLIATPGQ